MPRQNRVTPFGEMIATPERGTFLGNRGVIHNAEGRIKRPWQLKRWLICLLEFKNRRRSVMTPGRYTELFFLDEATALAAGHRPCAECRRDRFLEFCKLWPPATSHRRLATAPLASVIDERLYSERVTAHGMQKTFSANLEALPDGAFFTMSTADQQAYLLWDGHAFPWSPGGYLDPFPRPRNREVTVLTPRSTVAVLRAGYQPVVHSTAFRSRVD